MLSSIFEQATKSVPRAVLYAGIFPVVAIALINLVVGAALLGLDVSTVVNAPLSQTPTAMAGWVTAGTLMLTIVGTAVAAMAPLFRGMLEGPSRPLGFSISEAAKQQRTAAANERRKTAQEARQALATRARLRSEQEGLLRKARLLARRDAATPEEIDALTAQVNTALASNDEERGALDAVTILTRHWTRHGTGKTGAAHTAILAHLDGLMEQAREALAVRSDLRAKADAASGPVTRYGRTLRFVETYVVSVYNIDSIVFWSRLHYVIPASYSARIEDAKHTLDLLSTMTVLLWASTAFWFGAIQWAFPSVAALVWVSLGGWALGYFFYRAATVAALSFAELMCAAFDLFRRDLLSTLGVEPPLTLREERETWLKLGQLMLYGQVAEDLKLKPARPLAPSPLADAGRPGENAPHPPGTIVVPNAAAGSGG